MNEIIEDMRFTMLKENKSNEFLYGFWFKHKTEWITENEIFLENSNTFYNAKVGWSFVIAVERSIILYSCGDTPICLLKNLVK